MRLILVCIFAANLAHADRPDVATLADLSIEELSQITVTSVSKKEQSLRSAATAIYVISQKDISRSTATSFPELLRMVPGLYVARLNTYTWSLTARGFGGVFANKLLVLIDGRTIYSPLFSGTFWEIQDYPLQDIERIEVIRGPSGTVWGSNAVNGVINIITKRAKDTQGLSASIQAGNEIHSIGNISYGFRTGDTEGRLYARGRVLDESTRLTGGSSADGLSGGQTGFRLDHTSGKTQIVTQGDYYTVNRGDKLVTPDLSRLAPQTLHNWSNAQGGNVLSRLSTEGFSENDTFSTQFYYDRATRDELLGGADVQTYDLETQYNLAQIGRHSLLFGSGVRTIRSAFSEDRFTRFEPSTRQFSLSNAFIQDQIDIIPSELLISAGLKFEHNEFTGGTWQPSFKTQWTPQNSSTTVWSSVSRAVRIPSIASNDLRLPFAVVPPSDTETPPALVELNGSRATQPEVVIAYELGVRGDISRHLRFDSALYFSDYSRIETYELGTPTLAQQNGQLYISQPLTSSNKGRAESYGIENVLEWRTGDSTMVQLWHALQVIDSSVRSDSTDQFVLRESNGTPVNQVGLRAQIDLGDGLEFNPFIRFIDSVRSFRADSYWQADAQFAWQVSDSWRMTLNGVNLLRNEQLETRPDYVNRPVSLGERSYFVGLTYQY